LPRENRVSKNICLVIAMRLWVMIACVAVSFDCFALRMDYGINLDRFILSRDASISSA